MRFLSAALMVLALTAGVAAASTEGSASTDMQAGIRAFRAGDFEHALQDFLAARRGGADTPTLRYNLGVTFYKLGRDEEAAAEFRSLLADSDYGDFARYNLGLIAARGRDAAEARRYFEAVEVDASNSQLRSLAHAGVRRTGWSPSPWHGFLEVAAGYDDNVTLGARSALVAASGSGSAVASVLAGASVRVSGDSDRGLTLAGSVYDAEYPSATAYRLLIARAGPEANVPFGAWRLQGGVFVTHIRLGSDELETAGLLTLRAEHSLGAAARVRFSYSAERIGGGARYGYLSGWQNQFGARVNWRSGPLSLGVGYSLFLNRRRDLIQGAQVLSASPTRHQLETDLRWHAVASTELYVKTRSWWSRYDPPNVFPDGGMLVEQRRSDHGISAEAGAAYYLSPHVRIGASYEHRRNDTTIARYEYTTNRYLVSCQYVF